ncbi:MAG TPA: alpha/beta hydrolase [Burkholderiales bacterium]|nr:alpha/beta hydrolase [Burkholderiales bacterium]
MKTSRSEFHEIRGIRHHVRLWGDAARPKLFLLHGWMDVSASFQFLVDAFRREWLVIAPDWRGFGLSEWAREGYWFQDYYADLDALMGIYSPDAPASIVGHSMGGNIACTYTGIRPGRVCKLISREGFGAGRSKPEMAPARYERWLNELAEPPTLRPYTSFESVAERLRKNNPRLTEDKARFLAPHWARRADNGDVVLRFDPRHKIVNPILNHVDELIACWQRITCPALWVVTHEIDMRNWRKDSPAQLHERKQAFHNLSEILLEDCGHMMHHDQPEKLATIIEDFLLQN